jgi:prepilin-type N-terminal cleavage/methylation domain-containing protein
MNINQKHGFTLVEVMAAVVLLVMALALALAGYMFSLKNINQGDVQNELDMDVQLAMERLKVDLRLSSLDTMFYYPAGAGPYEAISFPMAQDDDGDGIIEQDSDKKILWDETVIYHIRPTTPNQLVKTTFKPRDNSLSDAQRQAQLESVVSQGDGSSTYNGQNASSDVIFENLLNWEIYPQAGRFDAYSPVLTRKSSSLGYILLDPGPHKLTFGVIDKNARSNGYKIGIDQLFVSPSYSPREAEAQLPAAAQSGAAAAARYMPGDWKGNYQLEFPATAVGDSFTLSLDNDRWEETNFGAVGYEARDTDFIFDKSLAPSDFVVQLKGNDITWEAVEQTGDLNPFFATEMINQTVRVHINGSELSTNGNWLVYNGRKCKLTFAAGSGSMKIKDIFIGEAASGESTDYTFSGSKFPAYFSGLSEPTINSGTPRTSDWIPLEINTTNSYLVEFTVTGYPLAWQNKRTSIPDCLVDGNPTNKIFALSSVTASYPEDGEYTSQIFDTHLINPKYGYISWNADIPSGTSLLLKVRAGSQPDLSDASEWDLVSASSVNPHSIGASYNRYVQFQALFTTDTAATATPKLKDVTIDWAGERQLVNVGGIFTKGPNYGMFEISVDGDPLRSALIVDLEIYKDVLVMNKESRRVTSFLKADVTPRNSGM